jgi:hypothetical protein
MRAYWLLPSFLLIACASSQPTPPAQTEEPAPAQSAQTSESLPMACTRGFPADPASGKTCEVTVPSRGGLCFASSEDACECACGESGKCTFNYSDPPQAVCEP